MSATKHIRILSWIYFVLSVPVILAGALICAFAMIDGGETALLLLPGGAMVFGALPFFVMAAGLRHEQRWAVVLAVIAGLLLTGAIISAPLGIYSLLVAYLFWRQPASAPSSAPTPDPLPPRTTSSAADLAALLRPANASSLQAHRRILGSAYLLFALYPGFLGVTMLHDWLRQLDEWSALLDPGVLLAAVMLAAAGVLVATVIALLRGGTWAVWLALVVALPIARVYPLGTAVAAYAGWVAYATWLTARPAPAHDVGGVARP